MPKNLSFLLQALLATLINNTATCSKGKKKKKQINSALCICRTVRPSQRLEQSSQRWILAALWYAEWKQPITPPANWTPPNFGQQLLLFSEIFEMFNSLGSHNLPLQEQCQTGRHDAKLVNLTSARETHFKFAKNWKPLPTSDKTWKHPAPQQLLLCFCG